MPEAVNLINFNNKSVKKDKNNSLNYSAPKYSSDSVAFSGNNNEISDSDDKKDKTFIKKFGLEIAAFITGAVGITAALKMGKTIKKLNNEMVSALNSVGAEGTQMESTLKGTFGKTINKNISEIKKILTIDNLTGVYNRARLNKYLKDAFNNKTSNKLHVFMFDIDRFKMVNTALGHDGGDAVLKHTSAVISEVVKKHKAKGTELMFARYGGEEFTLVIKGASKETAVKIAQEMRDKVNKDNNLKKRSEEFIRFFEHAIADTKLRLIRNRLDAKETERLKKQLADYKSAFELIKSNNGFTISAGLCSLQNNKVIVKRPDQALKMADIALNRTKESGRNKLFESDENDIGEYARYLAKDAFERRVILPVEVRGNLHTSIEQRINKLKSIKGQEEKIKELNEILIYIQSHDHKTEVK